MSSLSPFSLLMSPLLDRLALKKSLPEVRGQKKLPSFFNVDPAQAPIMCFPVYIVNLLRPDTPAKLT